MKGEYDQLIRIATYTEVGACAIGARINSFLIRRWSWVVKPYRVGATPIHDGAGCIFWGLLLLA